MQADVMQELHRMMDKYALDDNLNKLLKLYVEERGSERFVWSDLTRHTHFMLGGSSRQLDRAAALTELIALLSDIVDDLQDQDHGDKPWMKGEQAVTLNAVLALFTTVIGGMGGHSSVASEIGALLARSIHGQQMDITDMVRTEKDYFTMVRLKSGSLLQLACFMGYSLVDRLSPDIKKTIDELANCVGIAAQIDNDIMDVLRYDRHELNQ